MYYYNISIQPGYYTVLFLKYLRKGGLKTIKNKYLHMRLTTKVVSVAAEMFSMTVASGNWE